MHKRGPSAFQENLHFVGRMILVSSVCFSKALSEELGLSLLHFAFNKLPLQEFWCSLLAFTFLLPLHVPNYFLFCIQSLEFSYMMLYLDQVGHKCSISKRNYYCLWNQFLQIHTIWSSNTLHIGLFTDSPQKKAKIKATLKDTVLQSQFSSVRSC